MDSTSLDCPNCGQKNVSTAKLNYCTFCYTRFSNSESEKPESESQSETTATADSTNPVESDQKETAALEAVPETSKKEQEPAPPTSKPITYISMVCPHCLADIAHDAMTCPDCNKHLDEAWI